MTNFVIDSYAWIEYLNGSEKGKKVAEILEKEEDEFLTPSTAVAEIISKTLKENKDMNVALNHINNLSTVFQITSEIGVLAGQIHFENKKKNKEFGMLDAFVAATARKLGAKILTGDPDFKRFKEAVMI